MLGVEKFHNEGSVPFNVGSILDRFLLYEPKHG